MCWIAERLAAGEHDLSLARMCRTGLTIRADAEQLYRVIQNLVRNARQAIVAAGRAGEIDVAAWEDDTGWHIEVRDTGPGLPPKAQEYLFQPFQGGVAKGGSGLGLTIAAELVAWAWRAADAGRKRGRRHRLCHPPAQGRHHAGPRHHPCPRLPNSRLQSRGRPLHRPRPALVAQLDRVLDYESRGRGFESSQRAISPS